MPFVDTNSICVERFSSPDKVAVEQSFGRETESFSPLFPLSSWFVGSGPGLEKKTFDFPVAFAEALFDFWPV